MNRIAGVDEVGRGPLAGPVIAAAVILRDPIEGVKDSKQCSPKKREQLAILIQQQAICYAYGRAEVEEIDSLNIHHATLLAMQRAVLALPLTPDEVWVDGLYPPALAMPCRAVVKGDSLIAAISAASILAKVLRDQEMTQWAETYPHYGFEQHKGYPTAAHRAAIKQHGLCAIHRRSFRC